jgi:hypothetical protein
LGREKMGQTYRAPTIKGYRLVWQHRYGKASTGVWSTEEESLDKLVDAELKARANGFDTRTVGIPGRHLLYVSNASLLAVQASGVI